MEATPNHNSNPGRPSLSMTAGMIVNKLCFRTQGGLPDEF